MLILLFKNPLSSLIRKNLQEPILPYYLHVAVRRRKWYPKGISKKWNAMCILGMTLNYIHWWGSSSRGLGSVEYLFVTWFILTQSGYSH